MKKEKLLKIIPALIVSLTILSINLVSAQNFYIDEIIRGVTDTGAQIFGPIFGHYGMDEFLFAKVLLFFLLFSVIFMSLKRIKVFENNRTIISVIAILVSILAVRYLREGDIVNAILLPYGGLGAALAIFLPLLIFFMFLQTSEIGPFGRQAGWFIYGAFFLVFWLSREMSEVSTEANWMYGIALAFILINIFFNNHIHKWFEIGKFNKARRLGTQSVLSDLLTKINEAKHNHMPQDFINSLERRYQEIARRL